MHVRNLLNQGLLPLLIMSVFGGVGYLILDTAPQSSRKAAEFPLPIVEVSGITFKQHDIEVAVQGRVIAAHHPIELLSQTKGVLVKTHASFIPGGIIKAGETIAQIDQTDYQLALKSAEANLSIAEAALAIEQGQKRLAERQFALNDRQFSDDGKNKALALRTPQLQQAEAEVRIAKIQLEQAQLALERTSLHLPYDVRVLSITTAVGDVVNQQNSLATFSRADKQWIELSVPQQYVNRIPVSKGSSENAAVSFQINQHKYQAEVLSIKAQLNEQSRMAGVIVQLLEGNHSSKPQPPPLIIDTHISAKLSLGKIDNVFPIPKHLVQDESRIYVVDADNSLQLRDAEIKWRAANDVFVAADLQTGDQFITSQIYGIVPGSTVRTLSKTPEFSGNKNQPPSRLSNMGLLMKEDKDATFN